MNSRNKAAFCLGITGLLLLPMGTVFASKCSDSTIRFVNTTTQSFKIQWATPEKGTINNEVTEIPANFTGVIGVCDPAYDWSHASYQCRGDFTLTKADSAAIMHYRFNSTTQVNCNASADVKQQVNGYDITSKEVTSSQGYNTYVEFTISLPSTANKKELKRGETPAPAAPTTP